MKLRTLPYWPHAARYLFTEPMVFLVPSKNFTCFLTFYASVHKAIMLSLLYMSISRKSSWYSDCAYFKRVRLTFCQKPLVFLGRRRCPYIVFRFRYSYGFMFVYIYIYIYFCHFANGGTHANLYKALNHL